MTERRLGGDVSVDDAYDRLLAGDAVLRNIADAHGRPDPFVWGDGVRTGTSNFAAMLLHVTAQQISTAVALVLFDRIQDAVGGLPDPQNIAALTAARGVGLRTAQMFLIHQLPRPDVLPAGDLGIRRSVQTAWSWPALPGIDRLTEFGRRWSPDRTYAAALLWSSLQPVPAGRNDRDAWRSPPAAGRA